MTYVNYTYCDHFAIYRNIELLYCTSETNRLYVNYTSSIRQFLALHV